MACCKGCIEWLLKLLNFLLTLSGLAMVGYGIYLYVIYKKSTNDHSKSEISPSSSLSSGFEEVIWKMGRPMMLGVGVGSSVLDKLPKAWFIYLFIAVGGILFIISCFGCIGAVSRNGCCLSCYSVLVVLLILAELGCAAFIFFDKSWKETIPTDKSGDFEMIYSFLKENWEIVKWVALGIVILEALVFLLALVVRAANRPADYDSDDEYIVGARRPLINRQAAPAPGAPAAPSLDQRAPSRNDAWSQRMREKYGLDTSEFSYNPSEAGRQQPVAPPVEEKSGCTIM